MSKSWIVLGVLLALALPAIAQTVEASAVVEKSRRTVTLDHRAPRAFDLKLPAESFSPVGRAFTVVGRTFRVELEGTALLIDTDGDGTLDVKVEGASGRVVLKGETTNYAVRLRSDKGWKWAAAGQMTGTIDGTRIRLVDQNNDGTYDDIGVDAIVVGRGSTASFLSSVLNIDGRLWSVDVATDGTSITLEPYAGATGRLALDCATKAKVLGMVVKSTDGAFSYDLARAKDGLLVPAGSYEIVRGELGLGETRVGVRAGRAKPIEVKADATARVTWGGPLNAEFAYRRSGAAVQLSPFDIRYFGAAGEEYVDWFPNGKSPKITITNVKTGREIAETFFPGSC